MAYSQAEIEFAVVRSVKAGNTFLSVARSQDDFTQAEFDLIKTLKRRIDDYLEIETEPFRGTDGLSVEIVEIQDKDIVVSFSDGTTETFSDIKFDDPFSVQDFRIDGNDLIEIQADGTETNKGQVVGLDGIGIIQISVNPDGSLTITDEDLNEVTVGDISDFGENRLTSTFIEDGILYYTTEQGGTEEAGNVQGQAGIDGVELESVSYQLVNDLPVLFLHFDDGRTVEAGETNFQNGTITEEDTLQSDFDAQAGTVTFTFLNGTTTTLEGLNGVDGEDAELIPAGEDGADGNTIQGVSFSPSGNAFLADGETVGFATQEIINPMDTSLDSIEIDSNGNLVGLYTAHATQNPFDAGTVVGQDTQVPTPQGEDGYHPQSSSFNQSRTQYFVDNQPIGAPQQNVVGATEPDLIQSYVNGLGYLVTALYYDGYVVYHSSGKVLGDDITEWPVGNDGADGTAPIESAFNLDGSEYLVDGQSIGAPVQVYVKPPTTIDSYEIDANGDLIFNLTIDSVPREVNVGKVTGDDAQAQIPGTQTTAMFVDVDGYLTATVLKNGVSSDVQLGFVGYDAVESIEVDGFRQLVFNRRYSEPVTVPLADGSNGLSGDFVAPGGISHDELNAYNLTLDTVLGAQYADIGQLRPLQTHTVALNGRDLEFTFADTSSTIIGPVVGVAGKSITNISLASGSITFDFDDVSQIVASSLRYIDTMDYDHAQGLLTFGYDDAVKTVDVPFTRPDDGTNGDFPVDFTLNAQEELVISYHIGPDQNLGYIHGDWITDIRRTGDDLEVKWTNETQYTNLGDMSYVDGVIGYWPTAMQIDSNNDLEITYSDGSTEIVTGPINGHWITGWFNTGDDIFVQYNDEGSPTQVGSIAGFDGEDADYITSWNIDGNRDLIANWYDLTTTNLGNVDGDDGKWITDITRDGDDFTITFNDTTQEVVTIDSFDGDEAIWVTNLAINASRELEVTYVTDSLGPYVETVPGRIDGYVFDLMEMTVDGLHYTMTDGTDDTLLIDGFNGENGDWLTSLTVNETTGELEYALRDGVPVSLGVVDGADYERGMTNILLRSNGKLEITLKDGTVYVAEDVILRRITNGTIASGVLHLNNNYTTPFGVGPVNGTSYPDGVLVSNIYVDYQTEKLHIVLDDGTDIEAGDFTRYNVVDAELIADPGDAPSQLPGNLNLILSNGTEIDVGRVKGVDSTGDVVDAFINASDELVLTFNDQAPISVAGVKGPDGEDVSTTQIDGNGDLIITMADTTEYNAGFVRRDLGFSPYNPARTYNEGESCTFNGDAFVAREDGVLNVTPTDSAEEWSIIRYEGDDSPEGGRPDIISPLEGATYANLKPLLVAGGLRAYYSVDTRSYRQFQVDVVGGDFSTPIYMANENSDSHQVDMDLTPGTEYKWRCRDVIAGSGYTTDWSFDENFFVSAGVINQPTISIGSGYDQNLMPALAGFEFSAFSGTGSHQSSSIEIKRVSDDATIFLDVDNESDLVGTIIDFGVLVESTDYKIRVRFKNNSMVYSAWSDWLTFTTRAKFDNELQPVVVFDGADVNNTVARPFFNSNSNVAEFFETFMQSQGMRAEWEVYEDGNLVWNYISGIDITRVQVKEVLNSGIAHEIRVRYLSDRFNGPSAWSALVPFTPNWSITAPVLSYTGDVNAIELAGFIDTTLFSATNDDFRTLEWEFRYASDDEVAIGGFDPDGDGTFAYEVSPMDGSKAFEVRARYYGRYGISDWSTPLSVMTGSAITPFVVKANSDHTSVEKIDVDGNEEWSIPITRALCIEIVAPYIYIIDVNGLITKIDYDGNPIDSASAVTPQFATSDETYLYIFQSGGVIYRYQLSDLTGGPFVTTGTSSFGEIMVRGRYLSVSRGSNDVFSVYDISSGSAVLVMTYPTGGGFNAVGSTFDDEVDGVVYFQPDGRVRKLTIDPQKAANQYEFDDFDWSVSVPGGATFASLDHHQSDPYLYLGNSSIIQKMDRVDGSVIDSQITPDGPTGPDQECRIRLDGVGSAYLIYHAHATNNYIWKYDTSDLTLDYTILNVDYTGFSVYGQYFNCNRLPSVY